MPNYNTTLQINNSSLEEIITQLNNMPDAGGGSGGSIETCDVTVTDSTLNYVWVSQVIDGVITGKQYTGTVSNTPITNVVKGSVMVCYTDSPYTRPTVTNCSMLTWVKIQNPSNGRDLAGIYAYTVG